MTDYNDATLDALERDLRAATPSEPVTPPTVWGPGIVGLTAEWFDKRVSWCRSVPHLRAAAESEAQRPNPRRERIAALNQRISELQEVDKQ